MAVFSCVESILNNKLPRRERYSLMNAITFETSRIDNLTKPKPLRINQRLRDWIERKKRVLVGIRREQLHQCPLCAGGTQCDQPQLLHRLPSRCQRVCGNGGQCLVRRIPVPSVNYTETNGSTISALLGLIEYPSTSATQKSILWGRIDNAIRRYLEQNRVPIVWNWRSLVLWVLSDFDQ